MANLRHPMQPSLFGATPALPLAGADGSPGRVPFPGLAMPPQLLAESGLHAGLLGFDAHLARAGKTENTRRAFASDLRLLTRFLGPNRGLSAITTDDLNNFLSWMLEHRAEPCRPKTYARRVTTLKVFFAWLVESGVLARDPALAVVHRAADPPLPLVLTDAEVGRLLVTSRERWTGEWADPRPVFMVRLLLDTALKKGELVRLLQSDVALSTDPPTLLVRYDDPRWAQKERRVSFGPGVGVLWEPYTQRYGGQEALFGCTARNLEYILAELVEVAGLPDRTSFETLRWTSALRAYRSGMTADLQRERLGLSPVTWAETERKLELLAPGVGELGLGPYFPDELSV